MLNSSFSLSLVVPLYNEERRVAATAPRLADYVASIPGGGELIFVDDGSTDRTAEFVEGLSGSERGAPIRLLRTTHAGKGAAVSSGIEAARGAHVAFSDVDLATPLDDIHRLFEAAVEGQCLAIGSRALPDSRILVHEYWARELLGRAYNRVIQLRLAPGIRDTQCGAKVAPRRVWDDVLEHCQEPGFAWDVEVVATALAIGIEVREFPVSWSHDASTKVRVMRDGIRMLTALIGIHRRVRALKRSLASRTTEKDGLLVLVDEAPIIE
jgi:dolichyl-phosphate beta-glucosyltransferase